MTLSGVDLNLLRPLRALLEHRSVTRAAEELHLSQPTVSIALARLRVHFDDQLLVRTGNSHDLTPLGRQLRDLVPTALLDAERIFGAQTVFDAATSTRTFVIAAIDHAVTRIAPALNRIITTEAPGVRFEFPAADAGLVNDAPDSLRTIDGLILPHGYIADQPHLDLISDRWVCIADVDSSLADEPTRDDLLERPWVLSLAVREGMTPAARQLLVLGVDVRVAAVTPHFHVIPSLVAGTERVAVLPASLARSVTGEGSRIRIVEPPFPLDPLTDAFWWHRDRDGDAEHVWLRGVLARVRGDLIADQ